MEEICAVCGCEVDGSLVDAANDATSWLIEQDRNQYYHPACVLSDGQVSLEECTRLDEEQTAYMIELA